MIPSLAQMALSCTSKDIGKEVIDLISQRPMTEPEIAKVLCVSRHMVLGVIQKLAKSKAVTRRRVARRRADGQGFRHPWQYRLRKVSQ